MTLNAVIAFILRFSPNSISFQADYVTVVNDRPIMCVKYCLPVTVFHFRPKLTHPAARSLCDILHRPMRWVGPLRKMTLFWALRTTPQGHLNRSGVHENMRHEDAFFRLFQVLAVLYTAVLSIRQLRAKMVNGPTDSR